ncbi:MAG: PilZ domain-containing protein [Gammaproteobacteria bacterium]
MEAEKRSHQRFSPIGLTAHIIIDPPPPEKEIVIDGEVVDLSYRGIKIRLQHPLEHDIEEAELRISIRLPESGVPISIHGMIKHIQEDHHFGLQFAEKHSEDELDNLMFECIKYVPELDMEPI